MAGKLALVFLVFFVAAQCASALPKVRRDTADETKTTTDDTLGSIKNFFNENLNFDKLSEGLKDIGERISSGTKEFAETVKTKTDEFFNSKPTEKPN